MDTAASDAWVTGSVGTVMTLTKSHCEAFSHWLSTKGDFLDVDDYTLLQGLARNSFDWEGAGVSRRRYAGMLGNSMAGNVLDFLVPYALHAAGLVSTNQFAEMNRSSLSRWLP